MAAIEATGPLTQECASLCTSMDEVQSKRHQNALAPIGKLPAELIVKIASDVHLTHTELAEIQSKDLDMGWALSNTTMAARSRRRELYDQLKWPPAFMLSQTCHAWREIALGFPECWSRIQVRHDMSIRFVGLLWELSGEGAIHLDFCGPPKGESRHFPARRVLEVFGSILKCNDRRRLKSVGLYCQGLSSYPFDPLLRNVTALADNLETLVVVEGGRSFSSARGVLCNLSETPRPKLRYLSVKGVIVPWDSTLLTTSNQLTHVVLHETPEPTPSTLVDLLAFLRNAPQIKTLSFSMPALRLVFGSVVEDFSNLSSSPASTIRLARLERLDIRSICAQPLLAILPVIRIPDNLSKLVVICNDPLDPVRDTIAEFVGGGRDSEHWISPENIFIKEFTVGCWKGRLMPYIPYNVSLKAAAQQMQVSARNGILAPDMTAHPLPWSLSNLKTIVFAEPSVEAVPTTFWATLAYQETLEYVEMSALGSEAFIGCLEKMSEDTVTGTRRTPFNALLRIRFKNVEKQLRRSAGFLAALKMALNIRAKRLREIAFDSCDPCSETNSPEPFEILRDMADCVVWNGKAIVGDAFVD
ncbi:hypothetical protein NMY22_g3456 [Coprinellus aureogranulatus]|nr:hypothetical protein NMY22_g3456 [Coprinellus aureogranulatus]